MTRLVATTVALLLLIPTGARGDEEKPELREAGAPKAKMTLPGGKVLFTAVVEANMAKDAAGKPLSIGPDLWLGLHDRLSIGIVHSGRAVTGFLTGFGGGLCLNGGDMSLCKAIGLGDVYTSAGAQLRAGLLEGPFAVALVAGGHVLAFEPERLIAVKGGLVARIHSNRLAVELAPSVLIGANKRDTGFNEDHFFAPVTIFLRVGGGFSIAVQSGITFDMTEIGDSYQVPAAAGFSWWVTPHFSFDAAFGLAAVVDKNDMTKAFDQRSVTAGVGLAL